jgi:penicillin-binding protein 1A
VRNDENAYSGSNTLTGATAFSDNSIYAEVGLKVGTRRIARLAHRMGITTPLSTNPAMTIGGLTVGVSPLDMAHAYATIAHNGRRVSGTLADDFGPVAIQEVDAGSHLLPDGAHRDVNKVISRPVLSPYVAATETSMLEGVVQYGTGRAAATGQFAAGKTGTTENYGDAWFVGWDSKYTVAVWVGYPNSLVPMTNAFNGGPVLGGTFPALIWHGFISAATQIDSTRAERAAEKAAARNGSSPDSVSSSESPSPSGSGGETAGKPAPSSRRKGGAPSRQGTGSAPSAGSAPTEESGSQRSATPSEPEAAHQAPPPAAKPAPSAPTEPSGAPTGGVSPGG